MPNHLVIVGAGLSGTILATNLLRRPPSRATDIILIERSVELGRGVAYASRKFPYLLNVPAERSSAESAEPLQFLRYAQARLPHVAGDDFLPRELYGNYLHDMLLTAEKAAPAHVRLVRISEAAIDVRAGGAKRWAVQFARHEPVLADNLILALGTPPPPPPVWAAAVHNHHAYHQDPWNLPADLEPHHLVLIVGNGLTMVDVVLALSRDPHRSPTLQTISRRGLLPQPQTNFRPGAMAPGAGAALRDAHSARQMLKASRALARQVSACGGDWRETITLIRGLAPGLWARLPLAERRRFMRHVQPHWDVHRHRLPPQSALRLDELRRGGKLRICAGRVRHIIGAGSRLRVAWQPRGALQATTLLADVVVNATGPFNSIDACNDPLLTSMRSAGLIAADDLNLGIRTARHGACLNAAGDISERLFYLGPMLRAAHWEATAAAELRDHAEALATHLTAGGEAV